MKRLLIILLAIIPTVVLGWLVWKYSVNVPFMDEWYTPGHAFILSSQKQLTFEHLISQHNESRKFFPRLFFLGTAYLTKGWDVRYGMLFSFLLACLISTNIYRLSKITLQSNHTLSFSCLILSNLLIFSPSQGWNWLMGLQFIVFIPIACITTSLVILFSKTNFLTKFIVSAILSIVATFSYANGILCWLIILPALILEARRSKVKSTWVISTWLLLLSINFAIYFHDYHKPADHPSFIDGLFQPVKFIAYFLSFIGSPLGVRELLLSQIIGLISITIFSLCCFYLLAFKQNRQQIDRFLPWLLIGSYTLISGTITSGGRVGFGVEQSLSSRYITFSTYLMVALIYLLAIIFHSLQNKNLLKKAIAFLLVAFLCIYPANFFSGIDRMITLQEERVYGKACLFFINYFQEEDCLKNNIYPFLDTFKIVANQINQIGLLQPSLAVSSHLETPISHDHPSSNGYGKFDILSLNDNNNYTASGWAILPRKNRDADAVVLAYQTSDSLDIAFAVAKVEQKREDVAEVLQNRKYLKSGWSKTFSSHIIPKDATSISAWAFDSSTGEAYKLDYTYNFNLE